MKILLANYSRPKISEMSKKDMMLNSQIKKPYTYEEFKKHSEKILERELP